MEGQKPNLSVSIKRANSPRTKALKDVDEAKQKELGTGQVQKSVSDEMDLELVWLGYRPFARRYSAWNFGCWKRG